MPETDLSTWARFTDFVSALFPWAYAVLTSGAVGVVVAFMKPRRKRANQSRWRGFLVFLSKRYVKTHVIWAITFGLMVFTCFKAFDSVSTENRTLKKLAESNIEATIDLLVVGDDPRGATMGLVVSLTNRGAPAFVIPGSWTLYAKTASGNTVQAGAQPLRSDRNLDLCLPGGKVLRLVQEDALYLKAAHNSVSGYMQGFLFFQFPGISLSELVKPIDERRTNFTLSATSSFGQKISVTGTQPTEPWKFLDLKNPKPLDMPCQSGLPDY